MRSMNREKECLEIVEDIYNDYIGGSINTLYDYTKESDEFKRAYEYIMSDLVKDDIYATIVNNSDQMYVTCEGKMCNLRHIRFLSRDTIKDLIDGYVTAAIDSDRSEAKDILEGDF